eukprot:gene19519-975_t
MCIYLKAKHLVDIPKFVAPTGDVSEEQENLIVALERLLHALNRTAVAEFRNDNYHAAITLLKRAEGTTQAQGDFPDTQDGEGARLHLRATTYNNFGCLEKRRGYFSRSLKYLSKAIELERTANASGFPSAATLSNFCAVLTSLKQYGDAITAAKQCIQPFSKDLLKPPTQTIYKKMTWKQIRPRCNNVGWAKCFNHFRRVVLGKRGHHQWVLVHHSCCVPLTTDPVALSGAAYNRA